MSNINRDDFIKDIKKELESCIAIIEKKNTDYAKSSDPIMNFRESALMSDLTPVRTMLVRIAEKLVRFRNVFFTNGGETKVKDESVEDTIKDAINLLAIMLVAIKNGEK